MGFKGAVSAHVLRYFHSLLPGVVIGRVVEEVNRPDELSVCQLEASAYYARRPVEAGALAVSEGNWHQRAVMAAPHPPAHKMRECEGLQNLPYCRQTALSPDDRHRVVLSDVLAGNQVELLGAYCSNRLVCRKLSTLFRKYPLYHESALSADKGQYVVHLLWSVHEHPFAFVDVPDLENKAVVQGRINHQPCGVEGVSKHLEDWKVKGSGLGLVHQERQDRFCLPLCELHLRNSRTHSSDIP